MERLTTYLTAYGGIFSDIDRFPYRHGTSDDVSYGVWRDFFSDIDRFTYRHGTSDDVWWRMAGCHFPPIK